MREVRSLIHSAQAAKQACQVLLERGVRTAILTLGGMGAYILSSSLDVHVAVERVSVVDTSGAGDAFLGALAFYLSCMPGLPLESAVTRSCAIATITVQSYGTQSSYPERHSVPAALFAPS